MTEPNNELVVGPWELSITGGGGSGDGGAQYHWAGRGGGSSVYTGGKTGGGEQGPTGAMCKDWVFQGRA